MSDLSKRRLGDSWAVLPAKRGISVLWLRCVAHVLAVSILVLLPPMPRESHDINLSMALIQRFESDTDFCQSARKRTDVP